MKKDYPQGRNRRILVVDDNRAIHDDFRKILGAPDAEDAALSAAEAKIFGARQAEVYEIDTASQGEEALQLVKRAVAAGQPYSVAFVDFRMPPGWNGIETTKHLWEVDPELQVVICTAFSDYSWEDIQQQVDPRDRMLILKKPFDTVEVLQLAQALVEKWRLQQEARAKVDDLELLVRERTRKLEESRVAALNMMADAQGAHQKLKVEIEERHRIEAQLLQSQKMEAMGQLAGGVAHDFNNLLTIILGSVEMLREGGLDAETTRELMLGIEESGHRAASLTRQLLTFSRKQTAEMKEVELNGVINDFARMLRRVLREDIMMLFEQASEPLPIRADAGMLEQVLMNLTVNARDALPDGGAITIQTGRVILDATQAGARHPDARPGDYAWLGVVDTGTGMSPEVLARIFEPFFTTKGVGKGTGLGLATVYGIARQHQGWIEVRSEVGRGTTFTLVVPLCGTATTARNEPETTRPAGGTETILLVEDEAAVRKLAGSLLRRHGYEVIEAVSGRDALDKWKECGPRVDLVLTDLIMPEGINGRQLGEQLSAWKPGLKIIYASGYTADLVDADFLVEEGRNFITKPYSTHKLARIVREALDRK